MPKILLIQPHVGDMDLVRSHPHLPLGVLAAASLVHQEFEVQIIDQRTCGDWRAAVQRALDDRPLLVGVTSMTGVQVGHALAVSRFVKERSPAPVVWGGLHASLMPGQVLASEHVDMAVVGEGEHTLLELARALDRGGAPEPDTPGLWWTQDDGQVMAGPQRPMMDLADLPPVPYELVEVPRYLQLFRGRRTLNMEASRGCALGCAYCYNPRLRDQSWRPVPPEEVVRRVAYAAGELGAESIYFVDDNFFMDRRRGVEIARRLLDARLGVQWQAQGVDVLSVKAMSSDTLDLLARSGCVRFSFGADSGSDRVLDVLNKRHRVADVIEVNRRLADHDITLYYSLISGIPTETMDELRSTIELAFRLIEDNPRARVSPIYNYFPLPGTALYQRITQEYGFREPGRLEDWEAMDYRSVNVSYVDPAMKDVLARIYLPSLFLDDKFKEYDAGPLLTLWSRLYQPVARYRVRNLFLLGTSVEDTLHDAHLLVSRARRWLAQRVRAPGG